MFYDLFKQVCDQKGVSPNRACVDMRLSRSIAAKWKNTGATPSRDTLIKIAAYFNISVEALLGQGDVMEVTWRRNLDEKLAHVGCSVDFSEVQEEYFQWLVYPDGFMEVSDETLRQLNASIDSYTRFKLAELREMYADSFKPHRRK